MSKSRKFKCIGLKEVYNKGWNNYFTIGKIYKEEHQLTDIECLVLVSDDGWTRIADRNQFTLLPEKNFPWNKIKTFLKSLLFWLRVAVYYAVAFFIAYNYYMTHDFLITVPMCLIFISFLMADKLLIKL